MSPEDKERIFEPFYTKKVMGRSGSGLGMALVWGAVQDHKGFIDVISEPEKGTTITILFPAVKDKTLIDENLPPAEMCKGAGESILVVDDLKSQRELVSHMLEELGYHVNAVASGEAAVFHVKQNAIDLLVLDMIMEPGIDGLDTYKEIIKIHPAQKAIIVTGFSTSERVKEAQLLGAGACLTKPYFNGRISAYRPKGT